jgi:hypothetical protein
MRFLRGFLVSLALVFFTWLGFRWFPGHTYLQSDTQIYLPMLERLDQPGYLARDFIATRPHISFTIYDEVTLALRKAAHLDFEHALVLQQLVFRFAAMLGVYLLATALGSPPVYAVLISAFLNLGASLLGPAVLIVEYEPIPRGYAFGLILLALGLLAQRQALLCGLAAGLAFLYQPPTAAPFWGLVFLGFAFDREARHRWKPLLLTFCIACLLLANLAQLQPEVVETQNLFGRLSDRLVQLQHFRTRYSWVSLWAPRDIWSYLGIWICGLWATARVAPFIRRELRWFVIGLPLVGILTVPLSYLLLEQWHLAIIPQFQPARALLYTVTISSILCGVAGVRAALRKRLAEAAAWFVVVIAIPLNVRVFDLLHLEDWLSVQVFGIWIGLAVATALLVRFASRWWLRPLALVAPVLAVFSLPTLAHVQTYPKIDKKPVTELARWAKKNTWGSAMFLFPDVGHDLYPGIFRALSERALYVDWKSGGQVNYFESLADEWYSRFEQTMDGKFTAARLQDMLSLPVDYYVLERQHQIVEIKPVFENSEFVVYDAQDLRNSSTSLRLGTED